MAKKKQYPKTPPSGAGEKSENLAGHIGKNIKDDLSGKLPPIDGVAEKKDVAAKPEAGGDLKITGVTFIKGAAADKKTPETEKSDGAETLAPQGTTDPQAAHDNKEMEAFQDDAAKSAAAKVPKKQREARRRREFSIHKLERADYLHPLAYRLKVLLISCITYHHNNYK